MLKAVLFDVDGVLIDSLKANWRFFYDLMTEAGYEPLTIEQYAKIFHLPGKEVVKEITKSDDPREFERLLKLYKSGKIKYQTHIVELMDEVEPTVKSLTKSYLLGLVTSRERAKVDMMPALIPIIPSFKSIVTLEDTPNHKPSPEPLLLAAKQLGVLPSESVYVGDAETDMQAAKAAGMKFIAFRNTNLDKASYQVDSFKQLLELIPSLS